MNKQDKNDVQMVTVKLPKHLHKSAKALLVQNDSSFQKLLYEAVRDYTLKGLKKK